MLLSDLPHWLFAGFAVVFGLLWGSFLNVVIYRWPREMSVVSPPSHCPACGAPVVPWLNVPVLSYIVLRGRARCCGAKMSARYPLVEALGGLLSFGIVEVVLPDLPPATSLGVGLAVYGATFATALGLLAAAFIDLEHMLLPDSITLGGTVLGLVTAPLRGVSWTLALATGVIAYLVVWLLFGVLYKKLRGRVGMGLGDAKLLMLVSAWFGPTGAAFALFGGATQASVAAIVLLLVQGKIAEPEAVVAERAALEKAAAEGDEEAKVELEEDVLGQAPPTLGLTPLPFGPFIILAYYEFLFLGDRIRLFLDPERVLLP